MEQTHLQTYTEISLYTQQTATRFVQPCDYVFLPKHGGVFLYKKKFYLYICRCQCCKWQL